MTRDDLIQLRDRIAAATGPDRRLDAAIVVALRIVHDKLPKWADANFPTWRAREDGRVEVCHSDGRGGLHWAPAPFTASLDAAVTLVPEGLWWFGGVGKLTQDEPLYAVSFSRATMDAEAVVAEAEHDANLPLAICLARIEYEIAKLDA